jgi:hypothetical protein
MSEDHTYNGWRNYETWSVALHVDNDESTYNESRELVKDFVSEYDSLEEAKESRYELANRIKAWAEAIYLDPILEGDMAASLAAQLLQGAWSDVDWDEIAENWAF